MDVTTKIRLRGLHARCDDERVKALAARDALARLLAEDSVGISRIGQDKYGGRVDADVSTAHAKCFRSAVRRRLCAPLFPWAPRASALHDHRCADAHYAPCAPHPYSRDAAGPCALAPVVDDETETLKMFTHNEGVRNEAIRVHKIAELISGAGKSLADA